MQTAATIQDAASGHPLRHRIELVRRVGVFNSRADATARAALAICGLPTTYAHMGRGPEAYDDWGMALACLQAAWDRFDDDSGNGLQALPLADMPSYPPPPHHGATRIDALSAHLERLGLVRVEARPAEVLSRVQPGDIVTYNGLFNCGVCIEGRRPAAAGEAPAPDNWPLIAVVYAGARRPVATCGVFFNTSPARIYRWPEHAPRTGESA